MWITGLFLRSFQNHLSAFLILVLPKEWGGDKIAAVHRECWKQTQNRCTSSKKAIGLRVHIFRSDVNNWIVFEINSEPSLCFSYSSVTEGMRTLQDCDSPKGLKQTQKNFIKRAIAGFRQNSRIERYFEIPSNHLSVSLLLDLPQRRERDETPATRWKY